MVIPHGGEHHPTPMHACMNHSVPAQRAGAHISELQIPLNAKIEGQLRLKHIKKFEQSPCHCSGPLPAGYRSDLDLGSDSDAGHAPLPSDLALSHVQLLNVPHWFNRAK